MTFRPRLLPKPGQRKAPSGHQDVEPTPYSARVPAHEGEMDENSCIT